MEFRILGPLEVVDDGQSIAIHRGKEQALLAYLLLHPNELVPTDRLIDELWGERPPPTVRKNLQNAVSQLRKALGEGRLTTEPPGYRLRIDRGELDLQRFEQLAEQGRKESDAGLLREALLLWRGEPLANLRDELFVQRAAGPLDEARLAVLEDRIDADLMDGRHAELVAELERLIASNPLRERLYGQLMRAHYGAGRQADALETYQRARKTLNEELGLEPSPQLQALERRILNHDSELSTAERPPARNASRVRRGRRRFVIPIAAALVGAGAVALAVVLTSGGGRGSPVVVANSLVKIDPRTNKVVDVIPVGRQPSSVVAAGGFIWVVNTQDATLTRVRAETRATDSFGRLRQPVALAADGDRAVWVTNGAYHQVIRVNARTLEREVVVPLGRNAFLAAVGAGSLWVTEPGQSPFRDAGTVAKVDLATTRVERYAVGVTPGGVAIVGGAAWVGNIADGSLSRINVRDGAIQKIPLGASPVNLTSGFRSLWVIVGDTSIWRVNPATRRSEAVIEVAKGPFSIAAGAGAVWIGNPTAGTLTRIDPRTNAPVKTINLLPHVHGIAVGAGAVWVVVGDGNLQFPF